MRFIKSAAVALVFALLGSASTYADQTIDLDLSAFQDDGLGANRFLMAGIYPNYTINDVNDGDVITINVSNSAEGVVGYINNGAGSDINVNDGGGLDASAPFGQFYGLGNLNSVVVDDSITVNYTITVTMGTDSVFDLNIGDESDIANTTSDPDNVVGYFYLNWRGGLVNQENWKTLVLLRSGSSRFASVRTDRYIIPTKIPALSIDGSKATCSSGEYVFANGEAAKTSSVIYTLHVDGKAVSSIAVDDDKAIASHLYSPMTDSVTGEATSSSATWDLGAKSNYDARCEVVVVDNGASINAFSSLAYDSVYLAGVAAKELARENERAAATTANFTKEARELRKRIAARSNG